MEFILSCSACIVKQVAQVADALNLDKDKARDVLRLVLAQLSEADFSRSTPALMGNMWDVLEASLGKRDVYEEIKAGYDRAVLAQLPALKARVEQEKDDRSRFNRALLFAVCGNLIDLAATDEFDVNSFFSKAEELGSEEAGRRAFAVDDRSLLYSWLSGAKTLLYLGDNCGEIVTDKLFIQEIRRQFPALNVYYAVKGQAVLNDVTMMDAEIAGMSEAATVIRNGGKAAGTVLSEVSDEFRKIFDSADVIISKGQGNFEGLWPLETRKDGIFFLLMAKCISIAKIFGVEPMSLICRRAD